MGHLILLALSPLARGRPSLHLDLPISHLAIDIVDCQIISIDDPIFLLSFLVEVLLLFLAILTYSYTLYSAVKLDEASSGV